MTPALDAVRREELRKLAEGATPGPWSYYEETCATCEKEGHTSYCLSEIPGGMHGPFGKLSDAAYIAAVSPDTTLALLAYIAELEAGPTERQIEVAARAMADEQLWAGAFDSMKLPEPWAGATAEREIWLRHARVGLTTVFTSTPENKNV